jgi:hypothetical protein
VSIMSSRSAHSRRHIAHHLGGLGHAGSPSGGACR